MVANKWRTLMYTNFMDEGCKRMLAIMVDLVTRNLKTPEELRDSRPSPTTESLVTCVVQ
jgi:hypothetical protein